MILKDYWNEGQTVLVDTLDEKKRNGTVTSLPFPK
jgi:dimethylsulfoniopropionate demethylase